MACSPDSLRRRRWLANGLLAGAALLCGLLVVYPPGLYGFYPVCPVREFLHIDCPGCGATRALAALLRGRWAEAVEWNALFVGLLPFGLAGVAMSYWRAVRSDEFRWPELPVGGGYATIGLAAAFMVVRNLHF